MSYKIIKKDTLPDGTKIQLEDWSECNTKEYPDLYGLTIAAYPIAKNTSKYKWVEAGSKFRLSISTNKYLGYTNDNVKSDYEALVNREKTLQDLAPHFWYGKKDMWFLGMNVDYKED